MPDTEKSAEFLSKRPISESAKINVEINMCWGEYYKGKWTSPKSTELNKPLIIKNLSSFNKKDLLLHGRKDFVEKPAGKFRERLIFVIQLGEGYWVKYESNIDLKLIGGKFTFTSKNSPPLVQRSDYDSALQTKVVGPNETLFKKEDSKASWDNNRIDNSGKIFSINISQPANASQSEMKETIFTKKDELTNGFSLLPSRHPIENQFEAPLSYTDERSTLFAQPEEKITYVNDFDFYYPLPPIIIVKPPIIIDRPRPGWPKIDPIKPDFEDVINDPWIVNGPRINENINVVLSGDATFQFGNTVLGNPGKIMNKERQF